MRLKKSAHLMRSCSAFVMALSAVTVAGVVASIFTSPFIAQDYMSGALSGNVIDPSKASIAGRAVN